MQQTWRKKELKEKKKIPEILQQCQESAGCPEEIQQQALQPPYILSVRTVLENAGPPELH